MTYRTTFEKVEMHGTKSVKCAGGCGRRLKRNTTVYQTLNPFNTTADGRLKDHYDIRAELAVQLDEWKLKPERCTQCATTHEDNRNLSGCRQEDGNGWCLNPDVDGACDHQIPTEGGNTACGKAL